MVERSKFNKFVERKLKILLIPKPKKARKDIKVFKVLKLNGLFLHSPHYDTERCWAINWVYEVNMIGDVSFEKDSFHSIIQVSQGFHAYITLTDACLKKLLDKDYIVCEAIIPKGSRYFVGCNNYEICSDCLFW
jgi:hypothetical protein